MKHICPVCGYPEMSEPAYDEYKCPTYYICPSCGTEFGYHDATKSFDDLRYQWIASGAKWSDVNETAPVNWSPYKQMAKANLHAT